MQPRKASLPLGQSRPLPLVPQIGIDYGETSILFLKCTAIALLRLKITPVSVKDELPVETISALRFT